MADTTFGAGTVVTSSWLNDANSAIYRATSGISGAVNRTLISKAADFIDVKDFGATGNGSTDDTTSIQNAINNIYSAQVLSRNYLTPILYFSGGPTATYKTTSPLTTYQNPIKFLGSGCAIVNTTSDLFVIGDNAHPGPEYAVGTIVENLVLSAFATAAENFSFSSSYSGITIKNCAYVSIRDCTILGFGNGIYHDGSLIVDVDRVHFRCNTYAVKARQGTAGPLSAANLHTYRNCRFAYNKQVADYVTGAVTFEHCDFENNNPNNTSNLTGMSFTSMGGIAATRALHFEDCDVEGQVYLNELVFTGTDANKTLSFNGMRINCASGTLVRVTAGKIIWDNTTLSGATSNIYNLSAGVTGVIREGYYLGSPYSADNYIGIVYITGGKIGIGTSPAATQHLASAGTTINRIDGGTGSGLGAYTAYYAQGAYSGYIGTLSGVLGGGTSNDLTLYAVGSNNIDMYVNGNLSLKVMDGVTSHAVKTVATLPAAATVGAGGRAFVSDANATTFASIVAGGGANKVPVYCDGTNWRIG